MEHVLPHFLKFVRSKLILKDCRSEIHQILHLAYVFSPDEKFFFVFESIQRLENSCISALGHFPPLEMGQRGILP